MEKLSLLLRQPAVVGLALAHVGRCRTGSTDPRLYVKAWGREFGLWQHAKAGTKPPALAAALVLNRPKAGAAEDLARLAIASLIMAGEWDTLEAAWEYTWNPQAAKREARRMPASVVSQAEAEWLAREGGPLWLGEDLAVFAWTGVDGSVWVTKSSTHHTRGPREAVVQWGGQLYWASSLNGLDGACGEEVVASYPSHHTLVGGWTTGGEWVDGDDLPPLPGRFWERWNEAHPPHFDEDAPPR